MHLNHKLIPQGKYLWSEDSVVVDTSSTMWVPELCSQALVAGTFNHGAHLLGSWYINEHSGLLIRILKGVHLSCIDNGQRICWLQNFVCVNEGVNKTFLNERKLNLLQEDNLECLGLVI